MIPTTSYRRVWIRTFNDRVTKMSLFSFLTGQNKESNFERKFNKHDTGVFRTPDAPALEAKGEHLVFIYDDMMFYRSEYPIIEPLVLEYVGPGMALLDVEAFISKDTGKVIAVIANGSGKRPIWSDHQGLYKAHIRGCVFKVNHSAVKELDKLYGNNIYYQRHEIICDVWKRRHNRVSYRMAWMYIGIPEQWELDAGYHWEPLHINPSNYFAPECHYYHNRSSLLPHHNL